MWLLFVVVSIVSVFDVVVVVNLVDLIVGNVFAVVGMGSVVDKVVVAVDKVVVAVDKVVIAALGSFGALAWVAVAVDSVDGCYSSILHGSWCSYSQLWTLEMYHS